MKYTYSERELKQAIYNSNTIANLIRVEKHLQLPVLKRRLIERLHQITK